MCSCVWSRERKLWKVQAVLLWGHPSYNHCIDMLFWNHGNPASPSYCYCSRVWGYLKRADSDFLLCWPSLIGSMCHKCGSALTNLPLLVFHNSLQRCCSTRVPALQPWCTEVLNLLNQMWALRQSWLQLSCVQNTAAPAAEWWYPFWLSLQMFPSAVFYLCINKWSDIC